MRMVDVSPDDVERYKDARKAAGASNGTVNRELAVLAHAFARARKLRLLSAVTLTVRDHWLAEAPPRQGFFERDQYEAVAKHLSPDLRVAVAIMHTFGWRKNEC